MRRKKIVQEGRGAVSERVVTLGVTLLFLALFALTSGVAFFVIAGREFGGGRVTVNVEGNAPDSLELQFPVGVDPRHEVIVENPAVDAYFEEHVALNTGVSRHVSWIGQVVGKLALMDWYQNLAGVSSRLLVVLPGERREEVAQHFGKILGWDSSEREAFIRGVAEVAPTLEEGKFFPGRYTVPRGADPDEVVTLVLERFNAEVASRYGSETEATVPLTDALTIASILEREAYDFTDMRQISGVIWNRLFIDMNLQIDATLQYAKGEREDQPWWPTVVPRDKYIESPYNTYENEGLPPAPIANPSIEAILAALNPKKTDCLYYFHDRDAGFHCTATYEEHVALLKEYYGKGK
jgi:UPF0755 protein